VRWTIGTYIIWYFYKRVVEEKAYIIIIVWEWEEEKKIVYVCVSFYYFHRVYTAVYTRTGRDRYQYNVYTATDNVYARTPTRAYVSYVYSIYT
jgi:hypothetical protein